MRLRILSDLHREFGATDLPSVEAEVMLLAGDIATKQNALPWIQDFIGDTSTAYICGNHEFYGDKLPKVRERLQELTAGSPIHVLEDNSLSVGPWTIYGGTLWTDLALIEDWRAGAACVGEGMNDYKRIRNSSRGFKRLSPGDTRQLHLQSLQRMEKFFSSHDSARTIVMTHHAPSLESLPTEQRTDPLSCAYASHLDNFILRHQPRLWVHGHIHHSSDYFIGKTRVICNPQSYPGAPNPKFAPALVIEV